MTMGPRLRCTNLHLAEPLGAMRSDEAHVLDHDLRVVSDRPSWVAEKPPHLVAIAVPVRNVRRAPLGGRAEPFALGLRDLVGHIGKTYDVDPRDLDSPRSKAGRGSVIRTAYVAGCRRSGRLRIPAPRR